MGDKVQGNPITQNHCTNARTINYDCLRPLLLEKCVSAFKVERTLLMNDQSIMIIIDNCGSKTPHHSLTKHTIFLFKKK